MYSSLYVWKKTIAKGLVAASLWNCSENHRQIRVIERIQKNHPTHWWATHTGHRCPDNIGDWGIISSAALGLAWGGDWAGETGFLRVGTTWSAAEESCLSAHPQNSPPSRTSSFWSDRHDSVNWKKAQPESWELCFIQWTVGGHKPRTQHLRSLWQNAPERSGRSQDI